jgi:voltage-gated potassium channel
VNKISYIYYSAIALFSIILIGSLGFWWLEDFTFIEAFYMTMITISTVGFEEVKPLDAKGMLFTAFLIIISFGIFAYFITNATRFVLDGEFRNFLNEKRMEKELKNLKNHVIVCGFGRNGKQAVMDLLMHNEKVLVIENTEGVVEDEMAKELWKNRNFIQVTGNAVHEEVLLKSKIQTAKALITTLPSDADNLFIVLTAREFNKKMTIISRASEDHSDVKLKRAGATNVIMPDRVGGTRMAKLVSQPGVVEFLDAILLHSGVDVNLEEISCMNMSPDVINKSIRELNIRAISGASLIGLKTGDNNFIFNPSPDIRITALDKLIVMGTPKQIRKLVDIFQYSA